MANERELKLKITGDASKAEAATKKLEKALEQATKALAEAKAESKQTDAAVEDLGESAEKSGGRFDGARKWLKGFRVDVDEAGDAAEKTQGKVSKFGDSIKSKIGDGNEFAGKKLTELGDKLKDFGPAGEKAAGVVEKVSGKLQGMGPAATVATGGAALAVTGMVALGAAAVKTFGELADATTQLQAVMGGSAEDTSVLLEASRELGLGYEDLIDVSKEFAGNLYDNQSALEGFGIEIARTEDGAIDMNATFLNVVKRLSEIDDAALRAKVATSAFGEEGAAKVMPLVANYEKLIAAQKELEAQGMGLSSEDLASWKEMQASLREATGEFRKMLLVAGKEMIPELADLASNAAYVANGINDLTAKIGGLGGITKLSMGPVSALNDGLSALRRLTGDAEEETDEFAEATAAAAEAERVNTAALEAAAVAQQEVDNRTAAAKETYAAYERQVRDVIQAERDKIDAQLEAVNVTYAYRGAVERTEDALAAVERAAEEYTKALNETGEESVETRAAFERLTDAQYAAEGAALAQAAAADRVAANEAKAAGRTYEAADAAAAQRDTLLSLADTAGPGSTVSDTLVGHANTFAAVADNAAAAASNMAAYNRQVLEAKGYEVTYTAGGGIQVRAEGGDVEPGQPYLVGEKGPELRFFDDGPGHIVDAATTKRMLSTAQNGPRRAARSAPQRGGPTMITVNNLGGSPRQVAETIRRETRLRDRRMR